MGSELVNSASHISYKYAEQFEKQCPFYMSIGMSYDDYWNGDSNLVIPYRKAFILGQKRKNDEAWMMGRYFYDALITVVPALRGLSKEPVENYLEEPYAFDEEEIEERRKRDMLRRAEKFRQNASAYNIKRKQKLEGGEKVGND